LPWNRSLLLVERRFSGGYCRETTPEECLQTTASRERDRHSSQLGKTTNELRSIIIDCEDTRPATI
jgi:hypothetical protein